MRWFSLLSPAVRAQFDKLNCANKKWQSAIYGSDPNNWDNTNTPIITCYQGQKYALDKSTVTGQMLKLGGSSTQLQTNGGWWVSLTFNGQGTTAFGALSTKMYDNYYNASTSSPSSELDYFAIVLDGTPVAVPYMAAVLNTGRMQNNSLAKLFHGQVNEIHEIGDCRIAGGKIMAAIDDGFKVGMQI